MMPGHAGVGVRTAYLSPLRPSVAHLFTIIRVIDVFCDSSLEQRPEIEILVDFDEKRAIERRIGGAGSRLHVSRSISGGRALS